MHNDYVGSEVHRLANEPHARSQDRERFAALRFGVFLASDAKPLNGPPSELFLTPGSANYNEAGTSYPTLATPTTAPIQLAARRSRADHFQPLAGAPFSVGKQTL